MNATHSYYENAVAATEEFLGPAAERYINRMIEFHLGKDPKTIDRADIIKLKETVRVSLGILAHDDKIVQRAMHKFDEIARQ